MRQLSCRSSHRDSYLRDHINCGNQKVDEILSFDYLVRALVQETGAEAGVRSILTLRSFFCGFSADALGVPHANYPETGLYEPVGVRESDRSDTYSDLTALILSLREKSSESGVLLSAASGSGKTIAGIKAMFDCAAGNPLEGYLPCRIHYSPAFEDLIDLLPIPVDGLQRIECRKNRIESWLNQGPPLLIFCDLNTFPPADAERAAHALQTFQADPRWRSKGHRCIVAYRSTRDDVVRPVLKGSKQAPIFREYDLLPLTLAFAERYLRNFRTIESWLRSHFGLPEPASDLERDIEQLRKLATPLEEDDSSIIRTPLLMHFVSILKGDALNRVNNVATLYDEVVDQLLHRNITDYSTGRSRLVTGEGTGIDVMKSLMTRVALVMLPNGTRISTVRSPRFSSVIQRPENMDKYFPGSISEWPTDTFCPYYRNSPSFFGAAASSVGLTDQQLADIGEFSLMRRESTQELAFLHDSFLYYFASESMWRPHTPEAEADESCEDWLDDVSGRMAYAPDVWILPAKFLTQRLTNETRLRLVKRLLLAPPKTGVTELVAVFCSKLRCDSETDTPATKQLNSIRVALNRSGEWCYESARRLFGQVWNELKWRGSPTDSDQFEVEEELEFQRSEYAYPWLRAIDGIPANSVQRMSSPTGDSPKTLAPLGRSKCLVGFDSGAISIWNYETGRMTEFGRCRFGVNAIAVVSDNLFVTSDFGELTTWDLLNPGKPVGIWKWDDHSYFDNFSVGPNGVIGIARADRIYLWNAESNQLQEVGSIKQVGADDTAFGELIVLPDGRFVAARQQTLNIWSQSKIGFQHMQIARFGDGSGELDGVIHDVALLHNGMLVCGIGLLQGDGRKLSVWDPNSPGKPLRTVSDKRLLSTGPLCVLPENRLLIAGKQIYDFETNEFYSVPGQPSAKRSQIVRELHLMEDGRATAVLEHDVAIYDSDLRDLKKLSVGHLDQAKPVWDVVPIADDAFAYTGADSEKGRVSIKRVDVEVLPSRSFGDRKITAICEIDANRVAVGDAQGYVYVWNVAKDSKRLIGTTGERIWELTADGRGNVISVSGGFIDIWPCSFDGANIGSAVKQFSSAVGFSFPFWWTRRCIGYFQNNANIGGLSMLGNETVVCAGDRMGNGEEEHYLSKNHMDVRDVGGIFCWKLMEDSEDSKGFGLPAFPRPWPMQDKPTYWLGNHGHFVEALVVLPNEHIATAGEGKILRWDPRQPGNPMCEIGAQDGVQTMTLLANRWLVSGSSAGTIIGWDDYDREIFGLQLGSGIESIAACRKTPRIAVGTDNGEVFIFDVVNLPQPTSSRDC